MKTDPRTSDDELLKLAVLVISGTCVASVLFSKAVDEIREVLAVVALLHIKPFALCSETFQSLKNMPILGPWIFAPAPVVESWLESTHRIVLGDIQWRSAVEVSGRAALLIYVGPLLGVSLFAKRVRPDICFRTVHNLDSLIETQSRFWTTSRIARHWNLFNDDRRPEDYTGESGSNLATQPGRPAQSRLLPDWDRPERVEGPESSLRPEDWLRVEGLSNSLIDRHTSRQSHVQCSESEFDAEWESLNVDDISEVFEAQLEQTWIGIEQLNSYEKALIAVFACYYDFENERGQRLLDRLARLADKMSTRINQFETAVTRDTGLWYEVESVLSSPAGDKLLSISNRHAWKETVFISLLNHARKDRGVLPSAAFLWLKLLDRKLWYSLNNAGNAVSFAESAGIHAHYRAERQLNCPLHTPSVYQASRSLLEDYLDMVPHRAERRKQVREFRKPVGTRIAERAAAP